MMRRAKHLLVAIAACVAGSAWPLAQTSAQEQIVRALPASECGEVRQTLEQGVPIGPGFRRVIFEFPPNDYGIKGSICRLVTVGSGAYIENRKIRALADLHAYIKAALEQAGWVETEETQRFKDRSASGKDVFALYKNNAICVTTILINTVPGFEPDSDVKDGDRIYLGALYPYERDWWIAVDCFHL
jgi:hypothetical protein